MTYSVLPYMSSLFLLYYLINGAHGEINGMAKAN